MKIYCVKGYSPSRESGSIHQVHGVFAERKQAEEYLSECMEETRDEAGQSEDLKGLGSHFGTWTEKTSEIHGSLYVIRRYECWVSVDLSDDDALAMFRRLSTVGLLDYDKDISLSNAVRVDQLYTSLPFQIANLTLSVVEI